VTAHSGDVGRFIGRANELRRLRAACYAARRGQGGLVVIAGAAGVGKTRFCEEVSGLARRAGLRVVWGRCWTHGGAPGLWPWQSVLDQLCGDGTGSLLDSAAGSEAVAPERFSRFVAVAHRLGASCRHIPSCLLLDDVHAADPSALLLTRFVAKLLHGLPLLVVATRRQGEPDLDPASARLLDGLDQEGILTVLRPFDSLETRAYLEAHGVIALAGDLLGVVQSVTGGNPLFLSRLITLGSSDVPHGLAGAIRASLDKLSSETRGLLTRAAVLGPTPSVAEAASVTGCDALAVLSAVEEATAEGLVLQSSPDSFSFSHELVRDAVLATLPTAVRLDTHAKAAVVIGERGTQSTDALVRRAHHAVQVAMRSVEDTRQAVAACRAAASSVARNFAYEHGANLLATAVTLHEQGGLGPLPAGLLVERARAVLNCGRLAEARTLFGQAAAAAERERRPVEFGEAALGLGGVWVNEHRTPAEHERVIGLQRRALAGLPPDESALRCRLEARLAAEAVYQGGPIEPVLRAVEATRGCDDRRALAEALSLCHHVMLTAAQTEARLPVAEELTSVASTAGEGVLTLMGLCWTTVDLFHLGDPLAQRALTDLRNRADALGCQSILFIAGVLDVMLLIRAGRLDQAETRAAQVYELGVEVGDADAFAYYGAQLVTIRWLQGRGAEILYLLEEVAASPTLVRAEFAFRASVAALAVQAGQFDRARTQLDRLTRCGLRTLPNSSTWLAGMHSIVEAAMGLGDAALARQAYDLLRSYAHLPIMPSLAVVCFGSVERPLGLAALTTGDVAAAVGHLERAVEANTRLGNLPLLTCSKADLADALHRRDAPGDRTRAIALLEEAIDEAGSLHMTARATRWATALDAIRREAVRRGVIRREGRHWMVALDDRRVVIQDLIGMSYLARLLAHPRQPIDALALAGGSEASLSEPTRQAVLDEQARQAYADRARELIAELDRARQDADIGRAERLRFELDALAAELDRAAGLRGRTRDFAGPGERARTSVRKAIKRAVDEIEAVEPAIGGMLRTTITTGTSCCYTPDPHRQIMWSI
jgi:tetratricopeptide (TPR) repeat protein